MQKLSDLAALTAVSDCIEQDGLRVGIYTKTLAGTHTVFSDITNGMNESERAAMLFTGFCTRTA